MYRGKEEWLNQEMEEGVLPREFLVEVMRELLGAKRARDGETLSRPWKMNHVQYHDGRVVVRGEMRREVVGGNVGCAHETGTCVNCFLAEGIGE